MLETTIKVPSRLNEKLLQDSNWNACISMFLNNVHNYFTTSPTFFPEYTIHGVAHVNMTMKLADSLIPDKTLKELHARDIAILLASIAIHDIGMFITEDGLFDILFGQHSHSQISNLDKKSWAEEWETYIAKVKRYSDQQLLALFGEPYPVTEPPRKFEQLEKKDYLVYGEFLRRLHHRMAHHIAIHGFPGNKTRDIFENTGDLIEQRDIIGLIARSHGMDMRDTEEYIQANYGDDNMPNNFPIFYLMSVLRLADYLDAGKHRAPFELEDRQEISVSISKKEWKWNQCINIENYSIPKNKGNITIQAKPTNTLEFIKVERWLKDIQHELDICWSVLAEKYGISEYDLTMHRVKSNLLAEKTKKEMGNSFLTKEASLKANVELLKLLIQPLYGEDPSYGVREMIQNAVDACVERLFLEQKNGNTDYKPLVVVSIDTQNKQFQITDNGIGMNEDVLLDYYLSAGASYRYSDVWKKDFSVNRKDQIARTGKFGVGVLSSFLLGEKIHVTTRHINDKLGYEFNFTMEQTLLNVLRKQCDVGTTITIDITDSTVKSLLEGHHYGAGNWCDWYAFKVPQVKYYVDGKEKTTKRKYVPNEGENIEGWFDYKSSLFDSFQWTYEKEYGYYCNGIAIPDIEHSTIGEDFGLSMDVPSFSIVDKSCNLKINLARDTILSFPEEENFTREVYKAYLAKLLTSNPTAKDYTSFGFTDRLTYGTFTSWDRTLFGHYLVSEKGFSVLNIPFAIALNINKLLLFCYSTDYNHILLPNLEIKLPSVLLSMKDVCELSSSMDHYYDLNRTYKINKDQKQIINNLYRNLDENMYNFMDYTYNLGHKRISRSWVDSNLVDIFTKGEKQKYKLNVFPTSNTNSTEDAANLPFSPYMDFGLFMLISELSFSVSKYEKNNLMVDVINEYLGEEDIWIPYDFEKRKQKFPKAFEELKQYM